jgi:hypothetical protein
MTDFIQKLPIELQQIILNFIPHYNFVNKNDTYIPPLIDEYIIFFIKNELIKNMYTSSYLINCSYYKKLIKNKLNELSQYYTKQFMELCNIYSAGATNIKNYNNTQLNVISLNITFKFITVGQYYNSSTDDQLFTIGNSTMYDDGCCIVYYNTSIYINYTEEDITNELYKIFFRHMSLSDTMQEIKSMNISKINYPYGINQHNINNTEILKSFI